MIQTAKIVIASVLKPVNDVRMYEKIGVSLSKSEKHEVVMVGSKNASQNELDLDSEEWPPFKRLSFGRLMIQFLIWKKLRKHQPEIIICCTHELLLTSAIYKLLFGTKLVYDVQEDYFKTLWYQTNYPVVIRHVLACFIRVYERVLHPLINGYLLAEKMYWHDMPFARNKSMVLENKSLPIPHAKSTGEFRFLFSGTLSHYSRTKESIELFLGIKKYLPEAEMTVIGHCPNESYYHLLKREFDKKVELKISLDPVPHGEIVKEISRSNFGIIGYLPNPVNAQKVPTKLYEYTAAQLPYLVQEDTHWSSLGCRFGGAISLDLTSENYQDIASRLRDYSQDSFSTSGFRWNEQEDQLLHFITHIMT